MREQTTKCRRCGLPVGILTAGLYRSIVVDLDPVEIVRDETGGEYVLIDGTRTRGREVNTFELQHPKAEYAYRRHVCRGGR